jgi:outer membrane autotransporter protein
VFEAVTNVGDIVNRRIVNTTRRGDVGSDRSAGLRSDHQGEPGMGLSDSEAGQRFHNVETGVWLNGTYRTAEQDNTNGIEGTSNGYDSDILSIAAGVDFAAGYNSVVGISGAYSKVETDLDRSNSGETELDAYHISVYGAHRSGPFFVSGQLGYTSADVAAVRATNLGGGIIRSDFKVDGLSARIDATYDFDLGGGTYLAPLAGLLYSNFGTDDFVENGGLDLLIDTESTEFVEGRLGVLLGSETKRSSGSFFDIYGKVAYVFNLSDNATTTSASFGSQTVVLQGLETNDQRVELGAGFTVHGTNNLSIGAAVDGEVASNYSSIGGSVKVKFRF